jgi:hypothetical protein
LKIEFEWHRNWFSDETVALKIEASEWPAKRMLAVKLELMTSDGVSSEVVKEEKGLVPGEQRNDDGFLELETSWVFKSGSHSRYAQARATYVVYDEFERVVVTRDTLLARRSA